MKLLNNEYNFSFDFDMNLINELICESPNIYNELIVALYNACNNNYSSFVLSNNSEIMDFTRNCEIIFNPFQIDINNKKNIDKLYLELSNTINEHDLYIDKNTLISSIIKYINKLSLLSDYNINFIEDIDFKNILKIANVKLESNESNLVESLYDYMNITNKLQGERIYIFINLKTFITLEQVAKLYKSVIYNKFKIVLFENFDRKTIENEKKIIIDNDGCIIV